MEVLKYLIRVSCPDPSLTDGGRPDGRDISIFIPISTDFPDPRGERKLAPGICRHTEPQRPPLGFSFETPPLYRLAHCCSTLLLDLMVHHMMLHPILRECRGPWRSRRTELRHEGIGACCIRIALLAFTVAAGHGRAAEAEKDYDGDYAESFHLKSPC
jgi:hypothetical protein